MEEDKLINNIALRLIKEQANFVIEDNNEKEALNLCHYIAGVLDLAEELKKFLVA